MRLPALTLLALSALLPAGAVAQATLNKCIDAEGRVTYSNLPCRGAREVKKVEIDPPPPLPKPAPVSVPAPLPAPVPATGSAPVTVADPIPAPASQPPAPARAQPTPGSLSPAAAPPIQPAVPTPARTVAPAPVPAPVPQPARSQAAPTPPMKIAPSRVEIQRSGKTAPVAAPRTCDALIDQLGRVLDQMDAGQRSGVTQQQLDAWTKEIQDLEHKKREAGCF